MKQTVLFLCTGNSCRSQMAEAMVNKFKGDRWQAYSAGTRPSGHVHPLSIEAIGELGISGDGLVSKSAETLRHIQFDRVYTVCDSAGEDCPIWLGTGSIMHVPFFDPDKAVGSDEDIMAVFRQVRDQIREQIVETL
ncbi:MAG: arsenate reductase ArsC [Candidatus Promineifilaceae bacterium]